MGGATIIPRSPSEKKFQDSQKNCFLKKKSYMTLKYLLIIDFPKFEPLTAAEMALFEILGQNVKIYSP
jgi:hypothetical protein